MGWGGGGLSAAPLQPGHAQDGGRAGCRPQRSPLLQWGEFAFALSPEHGLAMGGKQH